MECLFLQFAGFYALPEVQCINGQRDSMKTGLKDSMTRQDAAGVLFSPPEVSVYVVKMACERPETCGKSLSQWDCSELVRKLVEDGVVEAISTETVRSILSHHKLKPWRNHMWLSAKKSRDEEFYSNVCSIIDLYTRPIMPHEVVLSVDEKTSLQPRPRHSSTKPAKSGNIPNLYEHEYRRDGALNLFAAFNTRTGEVIGQCYSRKRQSEFISFLEHIDKTIPQTTSLIHIVCDNVSVHHGKKVRNWLKNNPRFVFHFTPVHCSWINQVEQWFSIFQRKRFKFADFPSKEAMNQAIMDYINEWNSHAHPFNWSTKSVVKVMAHAPEHLKIAA